MKMSREGDMVREYLEAKWKVWRIEAEMLGRASPTISIPARMVEALVFEMRRGEDR